MITLSEIDLLSKLTIIVTVRERCKHLRRALDYYADYPVRILVMDSSDEPCPTDRKPKIFSSLHLPQKFFVDALISSVEQLDTPYVLIASDDDFFPPPVLVEAISYLEKNLDYQCVHGYVGRFEKARELRVRDAYPHLLGADVIGATPKERIIRHLSHYVPNFHAVHRRQIFLDALLTTRNVRNLSSHEVTIGAIIDVHGKTKILPRLFCVREQISTAQSSLLGRTKEKPKFSQVAQNPQFNPALFNEFVETLCNELKDVGIDKDEAKKVVMEALKGYAEFYKNVGAATAEWRARAQKLNIQSFEEIIARDDSRLYWENIKKLVLRHNLSPIVLPLLVDDDGRTIKMTHQAKAFFYVREYSKNAARSTIRLIRKLWAVGIQKKN